MKLFGVVQKLGVIQIMNVVVSTALKGRTGLL
nr:hypothetical protein CJLB15_00077 [Campylobacter phage CJLB-15]